VSAVKRRGQGGLGAGPLRRRPPRSAAPRHRDPAHRRRVQPGGSTSRARCRSTPSCGKVTCSSSRSSCFRPRRSVRRRCRPSTWTWRPRWLSPADGQERGHRRRRRAACPGGGRGDLQTVHGPCPADRYDPEPVAVLVDELTDQRCSGSHSRAKKLAALGISIVYSSSRRLLCSSRISRAASVVTPRASSPAST